MSKLVSTYFPHDLTKEKIKKQIGKVNKIHFTQQEALEILDSGNHKPLYDAFSTFIFKEANRLSTGDLQGALSHYTDSYFLDLYQEGHLFLTLALQRYDREKSDNLIGYCMSYTKGSMLMFKKRLMEGTFSNKSNSINKNNREEEGWVSVRNYGSYDDVTEKFHQIVEKTFSPPDQKEYKETLVIDYVLNNNHIFKLTQEEVQVIIIYFSDDAIILKEVAEKLNLSLNRTIYIYRTGKNKIRKHKKLIQNIL